jgi:hypothetical protein
MCKVCSIKCGFKIDRILTENKLNKILLTKRPFVFSDNRFSNEILTPSFLINFVSRIAEHLIFTFFFWGGGGLTRSIKHILQFRMIHEVMYNKL